MSTPHVTPTHPALLNLLSLLITDASGAKVTALPAKLVKVVEAEGEYARAELLVPIGHGMRLPPCGPCALQFFDPAQKSSTTSLHDALIGNKTSPKRLAMLAALATRCDVPEFNLNGVTWVKVEVFAIIRQSEPTALTALLHKSAKDGEFLTMNGEREVIHECKNSYGEVVSIAYGPVTHHGELKPETRAWLEERLSTLREAGFYQEKALEIGTASLASLPPVVVGAMDGATRLVDLIERFGYESVLGRLTERYEQAEVDRHEREQREREEAFARSMKRRRRLTLE